MKRVLVSVSVLLLLVVLFAGYLRVTAAPILDGNAQDVMQPKPGDELSVDEKILRAICRAEFDYFVYPVPRFGRSKLVFVRAWICPPNDIYLEFGIEGEAEDYLIYRCTAGGRPLWKAVGSGGA
ncbi:MAG TPA: hypothetical protein VH188_09620 [Chthoniobacterales bacterium]|jgi:hypothetical protein|nr:hypothetical protein [Chthoniobacterales bacterium]